MLYNYWLLTNFYLSFCTQQRFDCCLLKYNEWMNEWMNEWIKARTARNALYSVYISSTLKRKNVLSNRAKTEAVWTGSCGPETRWLDFSVNPDPNGDA